MKGEMKYEYAISLIKWYGGKHFLLKYILPLIPEHECYVEVFGGAAHVLFSKPPSPVEVYNDIDENLVNFFRVLRDPEKAKRLQELLRLTPYARKEFYFCRDHLNDPDVDDVERARRFFVAVRQSFSGNLEDWSFSKKQNNAVTYQNYIDTIPKFANRFRNVQIECDDFEQIIRSYDSPQTFFYCDPPYVNETIKRPHPYTTMTLDDHKRLVDTLLNIKGKAMLSGYDHEVYRPLEKAGWKKIKVKRPLVAANSRVTGGRRIHQHEYLWLNYTPPKKV